MLVATGTMHNLVNQSREYLKIITTYSPPHHQVGSHPSEQRVHGEAPGIYLTILQEIEEFDGLDSVDVVLLDAGINDVHATKVIDPRTSSHEIKEWVEIYCRQHTMLLVGQLLTKFKHACLTQNESAGACRHRRRTLVGASRTHEALAGLLGQ